MLRWGFQAGIRGATDRRGAAILGRVAGYAGNGKAGRDARPTERAVTADTDLRLCRFFGLSNGYWLRAQAAHDTEVTEHADPD